MRGDLKNTWDLRWPFLVGIFWAGKLAGKGGKSRGKGGKHIAIANMDVARSGSHTKGKRGSSSYSIGVRDRALLCLRVKTSIQCAPQDILASAVKQDKETKDTGFRKNTKLSHYL